MKLRSNTFYTILTLLFLCGIMTIPVLAEQVRHKSTSNQVASNNAVTNGRGWVAKNPFEQKVFVENKGQFDKDANVHDKVLFSARVGKTNVYFTSKGIIYRFRELGDPIRREEHDHDKGRGEEDNSIDTTARYVNITWEGANPAVNVEAENQQSYPYIYPAGKTGSIYAHIFKKIVYHNLYPGIDAVFTFPENKGGIKYALVVHPGANLSAVKLKYKGIDNIKLNPHGDAVINGNIGEFTDHAPVSFYKINHEKVAVSYLVHGREERFSIKGAYDNTQTLVVDPWTNGLPFTGGYNDGYDIDYDYQGNVYVQGGWGPVQLVKYNSAGAQQWVFNETMLNTGSTPCYGDFAVNRNNGESYCAEGDRETTTGANIIKVNTNGVLMSTWNGNANYQEIWRIAYNSCSNILVLAGGGTDAENQAAVLDTSFSSITLKNVLGASNPYHDMTLLALDPDGSSCYQVSSESCCYPQTGVDDQLVKLPLPGVTPVTYKVNAATVNSFPEDMQDLNYMTWSGVPTNGFNGAACSPNFLYTYDGADLFQQNKANGSVVRSASPSTTYQSWGGLDVDVCDNVYVGVNSSVKVYNSSLSQTGTIGASNTVYDLKLGTNYKTLYVTGHGFVQSININNTSITTQDTITGVTCGACNGKARADLYECGSIDTTGATYLWSNGATTHAVTGLCAGTYTVKITAAGRCQPFIDTLVITASTMSIAASSSNICPGNSTQLTASGAVSYSWSPATGLSATTGSTVTASPTATTTYTVVGTTSAGCTDTTTVTVTVTPPPTLSITAAPTIICQGSPSTLTASGANSYSWTPSTSLSVDTGSSVVATPAVTTTYTVTGTSSAGCSAPDSVTVTVNPAPTVSVAASPDTLCQGSSSTLTATGASTYTWSPSTGLSATTGSSVTANPTATVTYTVVGTSASGCTDSSMVTLTVDPPIVLTTTPTAASCGQSNGSVSVTASGGNGNYNYLWSNNATTSSISNLAPATYTVTVDDGVCSQVDSATVDNSASLLANISVVSNACNGGTNGSLSVSASGGVAPYSYSWTTSPVQTTDTASGLAAGSYTVSVSDVNGCSTTVSDSILQAPPMDTTTSQTNVTCYGGNNGMASITVGGGTPGYTYTWNPAVGTTNTVNNLSANNYSLTVTDANGCQLHKTYTITQPTQLTTSAAGFDASCNGSCDGQAVVIPSGGTPAYHYTWTPGNGTTASISNLCPGNYCVVITDVNGCTLDTCVSVGQPLPIALDTSSVAAHCMHSDGSATVVATGGDSVYSYSWNTTPVQTTATASNLSPGQYCVTVTDANGCTANSCIRVSNVPGVIASLATSTNNTCYGSCDGSAGVTASGGSSPYTYVWSSGSGSTANVSSLCAGVYNCVVADQSGCTDTVHVTITQPDSVLVDPSIPDTICIGQTTNLTATATGGDGIYTYTWTPTGPNNLDPTVTTSYTVTATDTKGCTSSPASVTVNVHPPLSITATGDTTFCIGGTATLNATATGGDGVYTYSWNPGSLAGSPVHVSPSSTTTYTVTVHDNCSTPPVNDTVTVNVNPLPTVVFNADTLAGCAPLCVNFTNSSTPPTAQAAWDFGDGTTSDSISTAHHCYTASGLYSVGLMVTDVNGCKNSLSYNNLINVYPNPVAAYSVSPQPTTEINAMIYFTDESQDAVAWHWSFGDGDTLGLTTENPEHMYEDSGHYASSLIVYNQYGCSDTASHDVIIGPEFTFYVPNAFSPNGDGLNDYFSGKGVGIVEYQMWIFDRWGNQIFYTDNLSKQWDGKVQKGSSDQVVQEDVYVWLVELKDIFGKRHRYIGHVSVIK